MKRRFIFNTMMFLWLFSCIFTTQCTKTPTHGYKYEKGQTQEFLLWVSQQVEPEGGKLQMFRRNIWGKLTFHVVEANRDTLRFTLGLSHIHARQVRFDQQKGIDETKRIPGIESLNGLVWTMEMKPDGSEQKVIPPKEYESHVADFVQTTNQTFREMFPSLPPRMKKGMVWKRRIEGPIVGNMHQDIGISTNIAYEAKTFSGDDENLVVIGMTLDMKLGDDKTHRIDPTGPPGKRAKLAKSQELKKEDDALLRFHGTGAGSGKIRFDLKTGKLLSMAYNTDVATQLDMLRDGNRIESALVTKSQIELKPYSERPKESTLETTKAKPASRQVR